MYEDITAKQLEILMFIKREINSKGYPPTVREICKGVSLLSTSSVHNNLRKLEERGYIKKDPAKPRTLEVMDPAHPTLFTKKTTVDIPIVGTVTAGEPILAYMNIEDTYPLPADIVQDKDIFILRVKGQSMINRGILDGDYVIIERRKNINEGEVVLALIEDEATIKTFHKKNNKIVLQPENDLMEAIVVDDIDPLGVVIGLYRHKI